MKVAHGLIATFVFFAGIVSNSTGTVRSWANIGTSWPTGANWVGGTAPADSTATDIASFGSGTVINPSISVITQINQIVFEAAASSYNLSGSSTYRIGANGISNLSSNTQTISANVRTSAAQSWTTTNGGRLVLGGTVDITNNTGAATRTLTVNGAGDTTFNGAVINGGASSVGSLNHTGSGTLTLAGTNTFSGTLTLGASGTLDIKNTSALGSSTAIFVISGGTIKNTSGNTITTTNNNAQNWNGNFSFAGSSDLNLGTGAVTMNSNRTVTVTSGKLTVGGAIAGSNFSLTKQGAGTLALSGSNTYSGGTTVSAGTLSIESSGALAGGALTINGGDLATAVSNASLGGGVDFSGGSITLNGTGTGSLTLAAASNFVMSGGTLNVTLGASIDQIIGNGGSFSIASGTINFDTSGGGVNYASSYQLFQSFGSGAVSGVSFTGLTGYTANLSNTGSLTFTANAIPEPSTYAVIVGALALAGVVIQRRRDKVALSKVL